MRAFSSRSRLLGRLRPSATASSSSSSVVARRAAASLLFLSPSSVNGGRLLPSSSSRPSSHVVTSAVGRSVGGGTNANSRQPPSGNSPPPPPPPRSRSTSTSAVASSSSSSSAPPPSSSSAPRVCVLGGGFGGLYTAIKLESLAWPAGTRPRVTLVDKGERFVFKPLLYELVSGAASAEEVAPTFARLLAPYRTRFVRGSVEEVVPAKESTSTSTSASSSTSSSSSSSSVGGTVRLVGGDELEYDWLVLALGADTVTYGVPGVKENCLPFSTFDDATRLNAALRALETSSSSSSSSTSPPSIVAVIGGGYAGVELAAVVAERLNSKTSSSSSSSSSPFRVELVTAAASILEGAPAGQRAAAEAKLAAAGVVVKTGAAVARVDGSAGNAGDDNSRKTIALASAEGTKAAIVADLVLWTAGIGPVGGAPSAIGNASAPSLPFPRSPRGAVVVEPTLRVKGFPGVFALGDVAAASEEEKEEEEKGGSSSKKTKKKKPLPPTAQVAFQQADYVAWNLWASINRRPLLPFRYQHLGEMMSLGAREGAVTLPFALPGSLGEAIGKLPVVGDVLSAAGVKVDEPDGITLEGPLAGVLRRAAYWYRQPTGEQRVAVGRDWIEKVVRRGGGGK